MNDNDLRNTSHDDYKRLMAEAYPAPKKDIRAAVMAQVSAEAVQSNKKAKTLTRQRMNRFVKFGSLAACFVLLVTLGFRVVPMMMKDAVVESTMNTSAAPEAPEAADDFEYAAENGITETTAETAAASGNTSSGASGSNEVFKTMLTGGEPIAEEPAEEPAASVPSAAVYSAEIAEDVAEEEAVEEEIVAEKAVEEAAEDVAAEEAAPVVEEAPAELVLPQAGEILVEEEAVVEEIVVEEAVVEETVVEEAAPVEDMLADGGSYLMGYADGMLMSNSGSLYGGSGTATVPKTLSYTAEGCLHKDVFGNSFHDIPQSVVSLVTSCADAESVAYWWSANTGTCGMNICELLTTFSVPRALFEMLYTTSDLWYHHDYNVDLLYGGDRDAAYEYYLNGGSYAEQVKRYFEYELKLDLYAEAGSKAYSAWASERNYSSFCQWSLAEFVRDFGISRERFTELHTALADAFAQTYPGCEIVEYDLDLLYGMGADITDSIARGDMGYVTDALYHKP